MIVTIDTNVLYQALRSSAGASFFILQLVRNRRLKMALSLQVFKEYEDVLTRETSIQDFGLSRIDIETVLKFVSFVGVEFEPFFLFRPNLRDESDNIFVELAICSNSNYLITSNVKDFQNSELNIQFLNVITPANFVSKWRKNNE